jgi:nucleotide-binding universal stress UspA family protein
MFPFKKILFPVDFSLNSIRAAAYASAMACRFQAELTVLNVVPGHPPVRDVNDVSLEPSYAVDIAWSEMREKEARAHVAEYLASHLRGIPANPCVVQGDPAKKIAEHAKSRNTDLIVMATHGFGGFRRMLLGSTTAKVLHDVSCPVLTSAHRESSSAAQNVTFRTVVCALDLSERSEEVLRWAAEFVRYTGGQLTALHVIPEVVPTQWGYCDSELRADLRRDAIEQLNKLLKTTETQAEVSVESGIVANTVCAVAQSKRADLVVIGRHNSTELMGRLRDSGYSIIREAPCAVISI